MDAKQLNAVVHDREADFYDSRFLIDYGPALGREVKRELSDVLGYPPRADRLLDVACGTGYLALGAAAAGLAREVHATDLSVEMLRKTRSNAASMDARVQLAAADAEHLPYADSSFDLVVVRGALHHVPDPVAMMSDLRRICSEDGVVVCIAEPTPAGEAQVGALVTSVYKTVNLARRLANKRDRADRAEHDHWELASMAANLHTFTRDDLEQIAEKSGFQDVTVGSSSWAWILTLGVSYYLAGEFEELWKYRAIKRVARGMVEAAAALDRALLTDVIPAKYHHTVWAVLR